MSLIPDTSVYTYRFHISKYTHMVTNELCFGVRSLHETSFISGWNCDPDVKSIPYVFLSTSSFVSNCGKKKTQCALSLFSILTTLLFYIFSCKYTVTLFLYTVVLFFFYQIDVTRLVTLLLDEIHDARWVRRCRKTQLVVPR